MAQQPKQYQGPLQIGALQGDAEFSYTLKRKDTVFQGAFHLQASDLAGIRQNPLSFFSIDGEFEDDRPQGQWELRQGEFFSTGKAELKDHVYHLEVSGHEHVSSGTLQNGKPDGQWQIHTWHIEASEIEDSLLAGHFFFGEGIPRGGFSIRKDSLRLQGRFQNEGLADSTWMLTSPGSSPTTQQWQFAQGLLTGIILVEDGQSDSLFTGTGQPTTLEMDERFFRIVRLQLELRHKDRNLPPGIEDVFLSSLSHFYRIDSVLAVLSETSFMPRFRAKLQHAPYSADEEQALGIMAENTRNAQTVLSALQADAQLQLLRLSDPGIAFYLGAAQVIEDEFVHPLNQILRYDREELLEFLPRQKLISRWLPPGPLKVAPPEAAEADSSYSLQDTSAVDPTATGLARAAQISEVSLRSVQDLQDRLNRLVEQKHREKRLVELEDSLMARYAVVQDQIDSLQQNVNLSNQTVWGALQQVAENELSRYSRVDERAEKAQHAEELMRCLGEIQKLAESMADIPQQKEEVENTYTRKVWNPYTYTHMSEKVKTRILEAYSEILLPHFLGQVASTTSCEEIPRHQGQFRELYERMLELRVQNTNKIERRLKRLQVPEEILELFGLETGPEGN